MLQELRTDMGTEFLNGVVEACWKKNGVLHGKTTGYSSQSNGLGERCWRTTMDRTRAALKEWGLPGGYWWDAMRHCIGIMNRSPHAKLSRTPFEVFTGNLPSVERLKVFGCGAYASIPSPLRDGKLGDRAQHAGYLGRATDSAADVFLLYNGSVRGFRHARFYEQEFPWLGGARCDVGKGVCVVGLEEADGGEDAGGSGVFAGGAGNAGGPGVAAGSAGGMDAGGP